MKESEIVRILTRKLIPFIFLYGLYLVSFGHITPGGGFQGGVVLGSGIILLVISQGLERAGRLISIKGLGVSEALMLASLIIIGVFGIIFGKYFLSVLIAPTKGLLHPSVRMITLLDLIIGFKVGAGIAVIFYSLALAVEKR